ncbi:MAG: hypothetical protein IPL01_18320 [Acidobacteria bacterium]|nr:hypothetical protein [Acidobacteriota bacterium]
MKSSTFAAWARVTASGSLCTAGVGALAVNPFDDGLRYVVARKAQRRKWHGLAFGAAIFCIKFTRRQRVSRHPQAAHRCLRMAR